MAAVFQLAKHLVSEPESLDLPRIVLRNFVDPADIRLWLDTRRLAFADERPSPGEWSEANFRREFVDRWWWRPERMWFAVADQESAARVVGTITLAMRGDIDRATPVVHWLMVLPEWRGRGVGRLLLAALERETWRSGLREIRLETHIGWQAAARFYESQGYRLIV